MPAILAPKPSQSFRISTRPGDRTDVHLEPLDSDRTKVTVRRHQEVPDSFLEARKREREVQGGRAPLGDSHGAWQKIGEIPIDLLLQKVPLDQIEDPDAVAAVLNDPEFAAFRSDGDHRTF